MQFGGFGALGGKESRPLMSHGKATRGKYEGKSMEWLLSNDPGYLVWLYENTKDHGLTPQDHKTARLAKEQHDDEKAERRQRGTRRQTHGFDALWGSDDDEDYDG